MQSLDFQKDKIIEDYKVLSLRALAIKYNSTKYLMKNFLIKNGVELKNYHKLAESTLQSGLKKCSKCGLVLPLNSFGVLNSAICGRKSSCKKCRSILEPSRVEYYKKWREENFEIKARLDKEYREKNIEKIKSYKKSPEYKKIKALSDKKQYEKIKKDPKRLLNAKVKSSMSESIKFNKKNSYFKILGYTIDDLKIKLENTFSKGMSWDNYGRNGWHIDHIKPLVLFDMTKESEFISAWSLNNLQAMWESDNCSKGSFYENKRHTRNGRDGKSSKK